MSTDTTPINEREALWNRFLERWPLDKLGEMTLQQYNQVGNDDHFCRWLEKHTESLGSIWGGSALKFGIYSRSKTAAKSPSSQKGVLQDDFYGWYRKYGSTADEAFLKIRELIVRAAQSARAGRMDTLEQIDLWPVLRRKIAFLYQDRNHPFLLPIYLAPMLRLGWPGQGQPPQDAESLYKGLMSGRGKQDLLSYADEVMARITAAREQQASTQRADVLVHFAAVDNLAAHLQTAGQTQAFCHLALALNDAGLDWWVTGAQAIHAGRTDDPKVWQTVVALQLRVTAQGLQVRLNTTDDGSTNPDWQMLQADKVDRLAQEAADDTRVPVLAGRNACWPDDYDASETQLTVLLSEDAVKQGTVKVPKLQLLFPSSVIADDANAPSDTFTLSLPGGTQVKTRVLAKPQQLEATFQPLFERYGLKKGDRVTIRKMGDGSYQLQLQPLPMFPAPAHRPTMTEPLNQILYGPPGTGKTYATIDAALKILDRPFWEQHQSDRKALKDRFDVLSKAQRVRFVTFHQSFSYEDFVEGIRATLPSHEDETVKAVNYEVQPGVFLELCRDAKRDRRLDDSLGVRDGAKVWKLSIEEASSSGETRKYCLTHDEARIGWPVADDLNQANLSDPALNLGTNEQHSLTDFGKNITPGDVVVCLATKTTISAVGVVTGEYEYTPQVPPGVRSDYVHKLPVKWLATGLDFDILALNRGVQLTLKAVYHLWRIQWPDLLAALRDKGVVFQSAALPAPGASEPHVLIIDEINRGNIARIFGELITLIEPSKRAGADEALEVVLPYSKTRFSVPKNVYLIGTMNTADRSLTGLDVALRRRFVFQERSPRPDLLDSVEVPDVEGVTVGQMLRTLNQRIEALLDRDHRLGHAYFMPLCGNATLEALGSIFRNQVLPLLQEYFFDDWQRIQWVLNDHRKAREHQFVQSAGVDVAALFGPEANVTRSPQSWLINDAAFAQAQSYRGIVQTPPIQTLPIVSADASPA